MHRIASYHFPIFPAMLAMLLSACPASYCQSLGDVARENRDKKAADPSATSQKVITNANIPKDPDSDAESEESEPPTSSAQERAASSRQAAAQRAAERRAAAQWKKRIVAQQNTVANLRMRVDRLKASIHFLNQGTYYDSSAVVAQNRYQARELERLAQLQDQLARQRAKLEDMQEAARKAGMHTATYDP